MTTTLEDTAGDAAQAPPASLQVDKETPPSGVPKAP